MYSSDASILYTAIEFVIYIGVAHWSESFLYFPIYIIDVNNVKLRSNVSDSSFNPALSSS